MIQPNQICGFTFTFYDASTKDGPDFYVNGIEVTYQEGARTITESINFRNSPELEANFATYVNMIADVINLNNAQK